MYFLAEVENLGHEIDVEGIHPTNNKVLAIENAPAPPAAQELRSFLGHADRGCR